MGSIESLGTEASQVPLLDLRPLHMRLRREIETAVAEVIDSNDYVLGKAVTRFEREAAEYLGVKHAIGVASGTDALLLSLKAAGVGAGDEVIVPAFTFFGTIEAIVHAGATPVFIDVDARTLMLAPEKIEALVSERTRAIMPVHLYGAAADMNAIMEIAERHRLDVIEDGAQAFGATLGSGFAGSFGLAGCFSFHPTKPLGALGDGGLIATDHEEFAKILRRLRDHGSAARYHHTEIGYNSRLDSLQAAILSVKLRDLDRHLEARRQLADTYRNLLAPMPVTLPYSPSDGRHCHAQFTLQLDDRDRVRTRLADAGVTTAVHYPTPAYRQPALLADTNRQFALPNTERACKRCLSLPLYEGLDEAQQQRVVASLACALDPA